MIVNSYRISLGPDYHRPPQVSHGRAPVKIMLLLNKVKTRGKERRKVSEDATGTVEKETHTCKGGYLKYRNNDWKKKRAGRLDGVKKCIHTVPTGNKVERE